MSLPTHARRSRVALAAVAFLALAVFTGTPALALAVGGHMSGQPAGHGPGGAVRSGSAPRRSVTPNAELAAVREARLLGRPVQVAGEQSATSTVLAEPDGQMRAVITAVPTRVRRGSGWVPMDTALIRGNGGVLSPRAIEEPLVFSGGGAAAPLVSLGSGADRLSLYWPGALPAPRVHGGSATYPGVLPGVDLTVTATEAGFTELLVVRSRAAGMRLLAAPPRLRLSSPGLVIRADGRGGLEAVNRAGAVVFAAPTARMWDSSAGKDPVREDVTAPVGLVLAGPELKLVPDRRMLTDPATVYPVSIDPSFSAGVLNWTDPLAQSPDVSFWNGQHQSDPTDPNGPIMVGLDPAFGTDARALFQMNTSPVNGKHILGATFRITEGWANSCTATEVDLWLTGSISSATTWHNQPSWTTKESSVTAAHRNGDGSCPQGQIAFNATGAVVQAAASGWPNLTLGLRAANEGDVNSWKRFQKDASLQIDYNSISTVGAMSTTPSTACVSGGSAPAANDPVINNPKPTLAAYADDADTAENDLTGTFAWQSWNGSAWVAAGSGTDPTGRAANTQQTLFTLPSGALSDGVTYRWQVQINDPLMSPYSGTDHSAWSQWCEFIADFTPPAGPAASSGVYTSGCSSCGGVGVPGTFTLSDSSSDVTSYVYGFTDPPTVTLTPAAPGGSVSFTWSPQSGGPYTLFVEAKDPGGNISTETRYSFSVAPPAPVLAQWLLNDPVGTTTLADSTGNGHTATLASGTLGASSPIVGISALELNSMTPDYATAANLVDTTKSYTVSTWVNLPPGSTGYQVLASEIGSNVSSFALQYDGPDCGCWNFTLPNSDTNNPGTTTAWSGAAKLGVWTLLTGVYDAVSGHASIYVNGQLAGTSTGALTAPWKAAGQFQIGRTLWNGSYSSYTTGTLADVQVWQRVLYPPEIQALADPSSNGLVEANSFEQPGSGANQTVEFAAPDPHNLLHDLQLQGTAQVPLSGAGYQGLGLQLDGNGYADSSIDQVNNGTPSQVVHTDQSFTVLAWVRLTGSSLPAQTMTALSQEGAAASGFFLGYRTSGTTGFWSFAMPGADSTSTSGWAEADSPNLTTAALGTWTQIKGVFDASAGTMTLYVNGQQVARVTRTATPWDATGSFVVGADGPASSLAHMWVGDIDEIRAYQGVLTVPAGDWQFSGCTGSPAACPDAGSGNHPVTLSSGGASIANVALPGSQPGPVLSLNGSTGVATASGSAIDTTNSFTVGAWIQMPSVPTSGPHVIVSQAGSNKSFFELQYNGDAKAVCFTLWSANSTTAAGSQACGPGVTAGQWMYVAGVYDAVAGTISLYTATFGNTPALAGSPVAFTSPWKATGPLRIGAGYSGGVTANFGGLITGVQVYPAVIGDLSTLM